MPYLFSLIAARRSSPADDFVSGLLDAEIGGQRLDENAVAGLLMTFMLGGHITTTSGVGNFVLRLARDAELQSFLRANPGRIPDAVEESLRVDTPQQAMPRRCVRDTEFAGQAINEGEYVLMNFGSANVDPEHWPEPAKFNLDRWDKRHVGFGRGVHQCIGAPLARMEMRVTAEELLGRTESFALSGLVRRRAWPRLCVDNMELSFAGRGEG